MDGLSDNANGTGAHAIHCSQLLSGPISNCYVRDFSTGNNQGRQDSWDPTATKGECGLMEMVAGVGQSTSGVVNKIYCCPTGSNHTTLCDTEVFASSDSPDYSRPDWDQGFHKGLCRAGKTVVGVSRMSSDAHAIRCCL